MKKFKLITNAFEVNEETEEAEESEIRNSYKEYFNGIDIFNKNFYFLRFKHRHYKWTQVFIDDILSMALSNSWSLFRASNPTQKIPKKQWPELVAKALINYQ